MCRILLLQQVQRRPQQNVERHQFQLHSSLLDLDLLPLELLPLPNQLNQQPRPLQVVAELLPVLQLFLHCTGLLILFSL